MPRCTFCRLDYEFPHGVTVVQKSGDIKFYCSSKCRKNAEMGRDNRKVKWVRKAKNIGKKADKKVEIASEKK